MMRRGRGEMVVERSWEVYMKMKNMTFACALCLVVIGPAFAQDQAQQNLRQQQFQEQNWQWHQMEEAGQQTEIPSPPPRPTGEWIKTWGAIADGTNGKGGVAVGQISKRSASEEALSQCSKSGGVDCKLSFAYVNQCVVIASGKITNIVQSAASIERARILAVPICVKKNNGSACDVVYSACSEPVFKSR